jgi:hypothetical protein
MFSEKDEIKIDTWKFVKFFLSGEISRHSF